MSQRSSARPFHQVHYVSDGDDDTMALDRLAAIGGSHRMEQNCGAGRKGPPSAGRKTRGAFFRALDAEAIGEGGGLA